MRMPGKLLRRIGVCVFGVANIDDGKSTVNDNRGLDFVEVDPSGRYGRYNEVLGKGSSKTVYRAFDVIDGVEVAWNQVQARNALQTPKDLERLHSELHLLKTLRHENIMKFYHSWVDMKTKNVNFITEIFTSGTLREYRQRHKQVDIRGVKNWSRQILRGLLYLHCHDPPIIHRDLKCDNIFVNGNRGEVKIGDLGLAAMLPVDQVAQSVIGTPEFMAPELYTEEYTELIDVYSFGMCLLEMVTSEYPYSECKNAFEIYQSVTMGKKPKVLHKVKDPKLIEFVNKCLVPASKRLSVRELLMDPFLCVEGDHEVAVHMPHTSQTVRNTGSIDGLGKFIDEHCKKFATVKVSYGQNETSFGHLSENSYNTTASSFMDGDLNRCISCNFEPLSCSSRELQARNFEFRVMGKSREDDILFLELRIANSEGSVHNIHFPFDIYRDTAFCVASEMIADLELTVQEATKIAQMIDSTILALVPGWKPGMANEKTYGHEEECLETHHLGAKLVDDSGSRTCSYMNLLSSLPAESIVADQSQSYPRLCLASSGVVPRYAVSSPRIECAIQG
eukprot:c26151_g2_i2 orf=544-2229(+)